jgi:hypothetical protein
VYEIRQWYKIIEKLSFVFICGFVICSTVPILGDFIAGLFVGHLGLDD